MKKILLIGLVLLSFIDTKAQTGINYKAVVKDNAGNVIANDLVQIQFAILEGTTIVYEETHSPTTDANGVVVVNIGMGTPISGTFSGIDWNADDHFLNVQIDVGSSLIDLGTTQFMSVPYAQHAETAANVSGIEALDEGNGIGWRLIGVNPDWYGDIGNNAIDFSISNSTSENHGALGPFSFSSGLSTEAVGAESTAFGYFTNAFGRRSTAMGSATEALGFGSTSIGVVTRAEAFASVAIGRYNLGGGNAGSWDDNDPLFEVGNGTNPSNRNNALAILKNGLHIINSNITGLRIYPGSGSDGLEIEPKPNGQIANGIEIGSVTDDGIKIQYADDVGVNVLDAGIGGIFNGLTGLIARSTNSTNSDIVLGGVSSSSTGDDGIIASDPNFPGSDIILRSNDNVFIDLDESNESSTSSFRVRNGLNSALFEIDDTGDVGIGTTSPDTKLHIVGGSDAEYTDGSGYFVIGSVNSTNIVMDNNEIMARSNNASSTLFLQQNGGNVAVNGAVVHTSDRRLKKDIKELHYGLNEILALNPVAYKWKDKPKQEHNSLGLIAQELREVISELVTEEDNDEKTLHVNYTELIPVLINAIKEQQSIIDNQSQQIQQYKGDFKLVFERLEALEKQPSN